MGIVQVSIFAQQLRCCIYENLRKAWEILLIPLQRNYFNMDNEQGSGLQTEQQIENQILKNLLSRLCTEGGRTLNEKVVYDHVIKNYFIMDTQKELKLKVHSIFCPDSS